MKNTIKTQSLWMDFLDRLFVCKKQKVKEIYLMTCFLLYGLIVKLICQKRPTRYKISVLEGYGRSRKGHLLQWNFLLETSCLFLWYFFLLENPMCVFLQDIVKHIFYLFFLLENPVCSNTFCFSWKIWCVLIETLCKKNISSWILYVFFLYSCPLENLSCVVEASLKKSLLEIEVWERCRPSVSSEWVLSLG